MADALQILAIPFLAALVLVGIHTYLGIHVLSRNIVFVDLALAQISALGATVAYMLGHFPMSASAYGYALAFTLGGSALLTASRGWTGKLSQETFIGVIYVMAAAAGFILVDKAPQGAEHMKQILVGSLLTATETDLYKLAGLYALVAAFHWVFRSRFLLLSFQPEEAKRRGLRLWLWDFLFYASFGVVVTSSVAIAGVLLVFSFLIIPAAIGILYRQSLCGRLLVGWAAGTLASALGLAASYYWDLPTGATLVCAFGTALILAGIAYKLVFVPKEVGRAVRAKAASGLVTGVLAVLAASGAWLVIAPRADQPLLDALERWQPGLRDFFLRSDERKLFEESVASRSRFLAEAHKLNASERASRWQGKELSDEDLRRIASYTQSFQEMQKGEQFVQRELRNRARERQRWAIGVPLTLVCLGFILLRLRRSP